eukprot:CAMPEP_0206012684 /NCGR_PEP_ID=MMETSP1464-20131121/15244_1 /ASSEMBLY_ACC=CAM_ASM_001124 /TAXON_ID=119497 /ORGANISM="Exanthemachrysis gayraliae, Strain RCC1523" /LENGTH=48 /DNA_ID= /DNA_START= /DNA_END= /DNA_ORIENTATION=
MARFSCVHASPQPPQPAGQKRSKRSLCPHALQTRSQTPSAASTSAAGP